MRFLIFCLVLALPCTAYAQVVISEVLWAGSSLSTADEWLELVNISEETVSLAGWTITKRASDGSDTTMISFPEDTQIQAGQYFLISNYDSESSTLTVSPDLISTAVSLANSKLYLQLLDAEGEVIDAVDDGTGAPFAGGKNPFTSMQRIDLYSSGEEKSNWESSDGTPRAAREHTEIPELPLPTLPTETFDVRITEVLLNPKLSEDYEWIEVGNLGEESVDITGWILSDGSRSHTIESRNAEGYILEPGEHTLFFHYQTGIALASAGEVITLSNSSEEIDRLDASETGEEISIGREEDGSRGPFCVPTPREPNSEKLLNPQIEIQSGRSTDYIKVTLNLKAEVSEGSLKDAECFWDFADGTSSKKCNPPSHSWDYYGVYKVKLRVTTRCGNEIERGIDVVVLQKNKNLKSSSSKSSSKSSVETSRSISSVSSSSSKSIKIEQKMYSINSSKVSSKNPVDTLPIRYKNITTSHTPSSSYSSYSFRNFQPQPQSSSSETGLPWVLLFSQSALWVVFAGKRLL